MLLPVSQFLCQKNSLEFLPQFLHSEAGRCAELETGAEEISCFETRADRLAS
jgi:hypothetical protein